MMKVPPTRVKKCSNFFHNEDFYTYIRTKHPGLLPFYDRLYILLPDGPAEAWQPFSIEPDFVIAFAFVEQIDETMANLIWLETRIPGYGFATYLRRRLRHTFGDVLPSFIPNESAKYWIKELDYDEEEEDLDKYMTQMCGDLKSHFNWESIKSSHRL